MLLKILPEAAGQQLSPAFQHKVCGRQQMRIGAFQISHDIEGSRPASRFSIRASRCARLGLQGHDAIGNTFIIDRGDGGPIRGYGGAGGVRMFPRRSALRPHGDRTSHGCACVRPTRKPG